MAIPIIVSCQLDTADADGIAQSQTPGAAGNLTINGALASGGVATLTSAGMARQVLVTTVSNESGKTLTIYGTNATGNAISETIAGPNATTGVTVMYYRTVTRVAVSAAFTGAVTVGTNGVGSSRIVAPDAFQNPFNIGIGCVASGTVNYTVEHTFSDVMAMDFTSASTTWFPNSGLTGETANADGNYAFAVRGIRVSVASGTGTVTMTLIQSSY